MQDNRFNETFLIYAAYIINFGILSIEQEKTFGHVDHSFLFAARQAFGVGEYLCSG